MTMFEIGRIVHFPDHEYYDVEFTFRGGDI